jgi:glycosyltransferase involved in cell wall biosynthesis
MQTFRPLEIIVVDDGSVDETPQVLERFISECRGESGMSVQYVQQANRGQAAAFNEGIKHSAGEFIQFLDSDDILGLSKIETQLAMLRSSPPGTVVFSNWRYFEQTGGSYVLYEPHRPVTDTEALHEWISLESFAPPHSLLWRRSDVATVGEWDESIIRNVDGEYVMRFLLGSGQLRLCADSWVYYRNWPEKPRTGVEAGKRTRLDAAGLKSRLRVIERIEARLNKQGRIKQFSLAVARHYAWLAERAALVDPTIADHCYEKAKDLSPDEVLNPGFMIDTMTRLLGFSRAKRLYHSMKRLFRIDRPSIGLRASLRVVETVSSLTDLTGYDE